ncbi:MAG: hypothetical protein KGH75_00915 [Rhodospirillales bacterium]|nr:hypothetical protein [Rhodospirillales bacterium]
MSTLRRPRFLDTFGRLAPRAISAGLAYQPIPPVRVRDKRGTLLLHVANYVTPEGRPLFAAVVPLAESIRRIGDLRRE